MASILVVFSCYLFRPHQLLAQENNQKINEDLPSFIDLIKKTQEELLEEAAELIQFNKRIQKIAERQAPEWNEVEGDDGNMAYDKSVAAEREEDALVYEYTDLLFGKTQTDPIVLAKSIADIQKFIAKVIEQNNQKTCSQQQVEKELEQNLSAEEAMNLLMQWNA
jgi:hypothetical protein